MRAVARYDFTWHNNGNGNLLGLETNMTKNERPFEGQALTNILVELAEISATAFSLEHDLAPLTQDMIEAGAEPLSQDQIKDALDEIQTRITILARQNLQATSEEWIAANGTIQ